MLHNGRVLLKMLLHPITGPRNEVPLDHIETADSFFGVANTAKKRKVLAMAVTNTSSAFHEYKKEVADTLDTLFKEKKVRTTVEGLLENSVDKALITGYLIGKYSNESNEYLDEICAKMRVDLQNLETAFPQIYESGKKLRKEMLEESKKAYIQQHGQEAFDLVMKSGGEVWK